MTVPQGMDPQTGTQGGVHRRVQHGSSDPADQLLRTYVLDTSVLLSDPSSMFRFAEHAVVLPIVVISELEGKRNDPEIGYFARQALRREEHPAVGERQGEERVFEADELEVRLERNPLRGGGLVHAATIAPPGAALKCV